MAADRELIVEPGGRLSGELRVPGDKSMSHRAVMFSALAEGRSRIDDCLLSADTVATVDAFRAMGVSIVIGEDGGVDVDSPGAAALTPPAASLDLGNSGTSIRLLAGLLAGLNIPARLTGDASLRRRPMLRVTEPLALMGAAIATAADGTPPLDIAGGRPLHAIDFDMPVASAQVKSALLLAGLNASGTTRVTEPAPTRDNTERMLSLFGVDVGRDAATASIRGGQVLGPAELRIPGDVSSAAFFMVGGAISSGADLTLTGVGVNATRTGALDILRLMGADIVVKNRRLVGGEPVADIRIRGSELKGIDIPTELVPLAIDEFPVLFIAAAAAEGVTRLTGAEELRVKESDRLAVMAEGLVRLGVHCELADDGIAITGGPVGGGVIDSHADHRIAMAFAMAGLIAGAPITIRDAANIDTSFPGFRELAAGAGLAVRAAAE